MRTTIHRMARPGTPLMARDARRRLHAALQTLRLEAPDIFSDREEDAVEYDSIVRDFETARGEALSAERYN
jgi:hypothetical protein